MPNLNFAIAFAGGLVSFFAPCFIPLFPAYVAYITGISFSDLKRKDNRGYIKKLLLSSVFYILGFSLVFMLLGTAAGGIGVSLRRYGLAIARVSGLIVLLFGLEIAGIVNLPIFSRELKLKLPSWTNRLGYFRPFLIGVIFAFAWSPCVGAVLGSILALAAVTETALRGATLLFIYSLGISVPFLIASLTLASFPRYLKVFKERIGTVSKIAGILFAILGVLLLTDTYKFVNAWIFALAFKLGYRVK